MFMDARVDNHQGITTRMASETLIYIAIVCDIRMYLKTASVDAIWPFLTQNPCHFVATHYSNRRACDIDFIAGEKLSKMASILAM